MMRTTLDIDDPVLEELKRLQRSGRAGRTSLGKLASELLADALSRRRGEVAEGAGFEWVSKPMNARIDLDDKEALYAELERDG